MSTVRGRTAIPVLLYHAVGADRSAWISQFTVTPATFDRHLELIMASGRTALSVEELRLGLAGELTLPDRTVVVTFDDGFAEWADVVAPALARWGLTATMFVTTGFLDRRSPGGDQMLSWSAVEELVDAGHEIGAHSATHPELDTLDASGVRAEIRDCRRELEDRLSVPVRSFAYPHGYSNREVQRLVRSAGYDSACAVKNSLSHTEDLPYSIARLTVTCRTSDTALAAWLAGSGAPLASGRERPATRAWRAYRRSRFGATHRAPLVGSPG